MMFIQKAYDEFDNTAKTVVSGYLSQWWQVVEGDQFGIDLRVKRPGSEFGVECEVKCLRKWVEGSDFPFETITISERKAHLARQSGYFIVLNPTLTDAVVITHQAFMSSPVILDDRGRGWEEFRDISLSACRQIRISGKSSEK